MTAMAMVCAMALATGCLQRGHDLDFTDDDNQDNDLPDDDLASWNAQLVGGVDFVGISGTATVTQVEDAQVFDVDITLRGDTPGAVRPWHVHLGSCDATGDVVGPPSVYPPLEIRAHGTAEATARLNSPLAPELRYAVDVHASEAELPIVIACGDLIVAE